MKLNMRKYRFKRKPRKILGIVLAVIGTIIIIKVIPIQFWLLMLGVLFILLGWVFFRMW